MNAELKLCLFLRREQFQIEEYNGDDVIGILESGRFECDDGVQKKILVPGDGVCFMRGRHYKRKVLEPITICLFRFFSAKKLFDHSFLVFEDKNYVFSSLKMLHTLDTLGFNDTISFYQTVFDSLLLQQLTEKYAAASKAAFADKTIQDFMDRAEASLSLRRSCRELIEASGLPYSVFLKRFKAATNITPQEYLINLRMQKACRLLADSALSVKDIAFLCGFENEFYFSNCFKQHLQMPPTHYRRQMQM